MVTLGVQQDGLAREEVVRLVRRDAVLARRLCQSLWVGHVLAFGMHSLSASVGGAIIVVGVGLLFAVYYHQTNEIIAKLRQRLAEPRYPRATAAQMYIAAAQGYPIGR